MRRQDKYPETKWFVFENVNPKNRITGDCAVRALTKALGIKYAEALGLLVNMSLKSGYSVADKKNIEKVLDAKGITKQKQPRHEDNTKFTGKEFCEKFNKGTYICSIGGHHVTVVVDGKIHDIWDCSDKTIGNYWIAG